MKCYCVVNFREPLQEVDQPVPVPQGSQVLLRVRAAGVCHSDIHLWEGGYSRTRASVLPSFSTSKATPAPSGAIFTAR